MPRAQSEQHSFSSGAYWPPGGSPESSPGTPGLFCLPRTSLHGSPRWPPELSAAMEMRYICPSTAGTPWNMTSLNEELNLRLYLVLNTFKWPHMASGCHTGQVALIQLGEFTALTLHILSCLPPCALVQMCRADPHSSEMLMDDTSSRKLSWIPLCSLIPQDPGTYPFSTFNLHTHSSFPTPTHKSIPRVQSQYRMHLLPSQPSQHSESPAAI